MMIGAPALAARGALRCGCGRVMIAAPRSILPAVLASASSATGCPLGQDHQGILDTDDAVDRVDALDQQAEALAIGPGCGRSDAFAAVVENRVRAAGGPLVLDADALHALAAQRQQCDQRPTVLTPHPGEFRVLAAAYETSDAGEDDQSRRRAAIELAAATRAIVVLKGHGTVVATRDGAWTCPTGGVELAIPGSGDVLTGILASVLAQQVAGEALDPVAATRLAVALHAEAGATWRAAHGDRGMLAEELADAVMTVAR